MAPRQSIGSNVPRCTLDLRKRSRNRGTGEKGNGERENNAAFVRDGYTSTAAICRHTRAEDSIISGPYPFAFLLFPCQTLLCSGSSRQNGRYRKRRRYSKVRRDLPGYLF